MAGTQCFPTYLFLPQCNFLLANITLYFFAFLSATTKKSWIKESSPWNLFYVKTKYLSTLDCTDPSPMWNQARPRRLNKKLFCKLFHKLNPIFPNQSTLSNQLPFHHVQYKIWISICQIFGGANKIMVWVNWVNASKVKLNFKPGRGYLINCRKLSFKIAFFHVHCARLSTSVQNPTEIWHHLWPFIKILETRNMASSIGRGLANTVLIESWDD